MSLHDRKFIVAYNFLNPNESIVLCQDITESLEEVFSKIDVSPFIGRGVAVYGCHLIDSVENAQEIAFEIPVDGKSTAFEVETVFEGFTLIEGKVPAGIYHFEEIDLGYCEIKDTLALTRVFEYETNFDYEELKFVCRADGISLQAVKDGEEFHFFEKHPLSYFDIYCPLCRQKVVTYETLPDLYACEVVNMPCPHFVGPATWLFRYDKMELDNLKINYKFEDKDIYFETSEGWEKAIILAPQHDPVNTIWDGSLSNSDLANHFFFVKSKPKLLITGNCSASQFHI